MGEENKTVDLDKKVEDKPNKFGKKSEQEIQKIKAEKLKALGYREPKKSYSQSDEMDIIKRFLLEVAGLLPYSNAKVDFINMMNVTRK